jgi:hypothetical protein
MNAFFEKLFEAKMEWDENNPIPPNPASCEKFLRFITKQI